MSIEFKNDNIYVTVDCGCIFRIVDTDRHNILPVYEQRCSRHQLRIGEILREVKRGARNKKQFQIKRYNEDISKLQLIATSSSVDHVREVLRCFGDRDVRRFIECSDLQEYKECASIYHAYLSDKFDKFILHVNELLMRECESIDELNSVCLSYGLTHILKEDISYEMRRDVVDILQAYKTKCQ